MLESADALMDEIENGTVDWNFKIDPNKFKSSTYTGGDTTKNRKTTDSKSGNKSEKEDTKFDWIKVKIDKVRESYENLMDVVNDSDSAYSTQLKEKIISDALA